MKADVWGNLWCRQTHQLQEHLSPCVLWRCLSNVNVNQYVFLLGNLSQQAGHPPDIPASKLAHSALFSSHRLQVTQLCPLLGPSSRPASRLFRFSVEQWQRGISQVVPVFPATSCAPYS